MESKRDLPEPTTTNKKKPRRTGPTVWELFFLADVVSSPLFLLACFLLEAFLLRFGFCDELVVCN